MPNKARKCTSCQIYFPRDMKGWKEYPIGWIHSEECRQELIERKQVRSKRKAEIVIEKGIKARKRVYRAIDVKIRKKGAYRWCHKYILERDKGLDCICCDRPMDGAIHAGHFLESGNNSFLRYHEDNIHAQRGQCNFYHGGDSGDYEFRLRIKIGNAKVRWLLANKGGTVKRTAQDYKEIEEYYKAKLKEITNETR